MRRRTLWLTGVLVLALGAGVVGVQQCRWQAAPLTAFSYGSHARPRVFVSHHPILPRPDSRLIVRLTPDLTSDASVSVARVTLMQSNGTPLEVRTCTAASGVFECQFALPAGEAVLAYSGALELSNGDVVRSRATYRFTVTTALVPDSLVEVRVPVARTSELADTYRVDTALARDPEGYSIDSFISDVEQSVFDGMLRDPAYRWRDDQLGFYIYARSAFVTSYYSGRDTRCGKNPWPRDASLPAALSGIETLGVFHRKTTTSDGIEGRVTAPVGANVFRDCAGQAVKLPDVGTFSATAGVPEFTDIATHEFGHAAFGLGDEYSESDTTRRVQPAAPLLLGQCCCVDDGGGGGGGGGGIVTPPTTGVGGTLRGLLATMRCVTSDGSIQQMPIAGTPPACGDNHSGIADACFSAPDGGCPPLAGDCVANAHWLGTAAGAAASRPNVFPSEEACLAGAAAATDHPGVEDPTRSLGTCRQVCGPASVACPCGVSEAWIVDRHPGATASRDDLMGGVTTGAMHGGTCVWCVETSLCVRWQRALGNAAEAAYQTCEAPPKESTGLERLSQQLAAAIGAIVDRLLRAVRF